MKKKGLQAVVFAALFANVAFAHNVQINANLPTVSVASDGELLVKGKEVQYKSWNSTKLNGKVRTVFHIAGRTAAKEKNEALMNAIKTAGLDRNKYQTTTIINADDAIVGTGLFVKNSAEKGKLENPHSQVVFDQKGAVKNSWKLKEKDSFVAVLDKNGKVQFVAEGKLSATDIQQVIALLKRLTAE